MKLWFSYNNLSCLRRPPPWRSRQASIQYIYIGILAGLLLPGLVFAANPAPAEELQIVETPTAIEISTAKSAISTEAANSAANKIFDAKFDPLKYTLGPNDVVEISVMRHPEFSGVYPINEEGKLQYKFVGDMDVNGLTKLQLEEKVKDIISQYVISPEVNITITDYRSKVFYVLGEVGMPGKYYMRSESIPVREAVFQAGLITHAAAMRKCRIITPAKSGKIKTRKVNLYNVLYGGKLKYNIDLKPGDVLYVPSTVMAKVIRMINPVTTTVGLTAGAPESASSGKAAVETLAK